jgi:hypothetical protein
MGKYMFTCFLICLPFPFSPVFKRYVVPGAIVDMLDYEATNNS